jgi:hypothetical protein
MENVIFLAAIMEYYHTSGNIPFAGFIAVHKLLFWDRFSVGMAPLVIGIFFFSSIQLISVGILGEYIGSIHTHVQKRPLVVERERVNFEYEPGYAVPSGEIVMTKWR